MLKPHVAVCTLAKHAHATNSNKMRSKWRKKGKAKINETNEILRCPKLPEAWVVLLLCIMTALTLSVIPRCEGTCIWRNTKLDPATVRLELGLQVTHNRKRN